MGEENSKLATRKEMIKTIIMWYTLQLKIGQIQWKHYKIFIKIIHCLSYPSLRAYYTISKQGLEKEKKCVEKKNEPKLETKPDIGIATAPFKKIGEVIELRGHITDVDWPDITKYYYKAKITAGKKSYDVEVKTKMPFFQWYERCLKRNVGEFYRAGDKQRRKFLKEAINTNHDLLFRVHEETMAALAVLSAKTIVWTSDDLKDITESNYKTVIHPPTNGLDGGALLIELPANKLIQPKIHVAVGALKGQSAIQIHARATLLDSGVDLIVSDWSKSLHIGATIPDLEKYIKTLKEVESASLEIAKYIPATKNTMLIGEQQRKLAQYYQEHNMISKKIMCDILTTLNKGQVPEDFDKVKLPETTVYDFLCVFAQMAKDEDAKLTVQENLREIAGELLVRHDSLM